MIIRRDRNGNKKVTLYKSDTSTLTAAVGLLDDLGNNLAGDIAEKANGAAMRIEEVLEWLQGKEPA
jgi:hypothetical protein